jgi:hypothetical protein
MQRLHEHGRNPRPSGRGGSQCEKLAAYISSEGRKNRRTSPSSIPDGEIIKGARGAGLGGVPLHSSVPLLLMKGSPLASPFHFGPRPP